jgi:hypothetical protein
MIFDDRGMPWTIRLSLGWTIVLALFSAGILSVPLGLYLAYWVRTKQGRSAAFWCYLVVAMIWRCYLVVAMIWSLASLVPEKIDPRLALCMVTVVGAGFLLLLVAAFVLRSEIISLYKRSWDIDLPISRLLTFFFSSLYLNYSVPDLPIATAATAPQEAKAGN